jgi:3-phosphoglycerate kinase
MKILNDITLTGKRVLIRVDFNVPILNGEVANDFRIRAALPTIQYCIEKGASIVLMSHLGRPKGEMVPEMSLEPVAFALEEILDKDVFFSNDCISEDALNFSKQLRPGEIHLLENLRFYNEETVNDLDFAEQLAQHADVFINDAFGTAHRAHASNVGIIQFMKETVSGFLLQKEKEYLTSAIKTPKTPFVVVLGGAKVKGKIELIKNMMQSADRILIGGAMAFTFLKVQGKNVGASLVDDENLKTAETLLNLSEKMGVPIELPVDVVVAPELNDNVPWRVALLDEIDDDEMGFDIGPETTMIYENILADAKTVLWNGPMGVFEIPIFSTGSQSIASMIQHTTTEGATTIIGGGDTAAAIESFKMKKAFSHVSTGGGASLELLSGKYLPAFKALDEHES